MDKCVRKHKQNARKQNTRKYTRNIGESTSKMQESRIRKKAEYKEICAQYKRKHKQNARKQNTQESRIQGDTRTIQEAGVQAECKKANTKKEQLENTRKKGTTATKQHSTPRRSIIQSLETRYNEYILVLPALGPASFQLRRQVNRSRNQQKLREKAFIVYENAFGYDWKRKARENQAKNGAFAVENRQERQPRATEPARTNQKPGQQNFGGDRVTEPTEYGRQEPNSRRSHQKQPEHQKQKGSSHKNTELHFFQTIERRKETGLKILWVGCRALVEWGC